MWWVTVSPLGFILATLGGSTAEWDPETRTAVQRLYAPGSATFHHDDSGTGIFMAFLKAHAQFVYRFSADYKFATLNQAFEVLGQRVEVPTSIVRYQMRWIEDGHFVRETWFFGKRAADYQLRRIVKADGTHDKTYDAYLLNADAQSYVVVQD